MDCSVAIEPEGGGPKADRDRHRLGVVEQERWQLPARSEALAASHAGRALDRIPE